ncbi:MAG: hypothetical protein QXT25_01510 [Candidatus Anstonellaceae archaeon]
MSHQNRALSMNNTQKSNAFAQLFYKDAIVKFIEKIAPKVSRLRHTLLRVEKIQTFRLGGKKVIKIVFS